jgi:tRNA(fMet)-specific endonuclease VapC
MNGNRYVLDTNAIIALLRGNGFLLTLLEKADYICISFISAIEFLAFPSLSSKDKSLFNHFLQQVEIIGAPLLDFDTLDEIATVKASYGLKIPDILIANTSIINSATLVTNDREFGKIPGLEIVTFDLN